jgi:hypothetical protein
VSYVLGDRDTSSIGCLAGGYSGQSDRAGKFHQPQRQNTPEVCIIIFIALRGGGCAGKAGSNEGATAWAAQHDARRTGRQLTENRPIKTHTLATVLQGNGRPRQRRVVRGGGGGGGGGGGVF